MPGQPKDLQYLETPLIFSGYLAQDLSKKAPTEGTLPNYTGYGLGSK
ncbi:MAG: hypothetical protein IJE59_00550 [Clostridia bacterium]|nr:hypothetical protein [Clostridia bacterium]